MNDLLKTLAPLLGTALGGPLGGAAASFIANKLGLSASSVEAVTEVLSSNKLTPDQIAQVKLAEIDFKKFLETNKIDVMKIAAADRASARDREIKTGDSWTPRLLAALIICGYMIVQYYVLSHVVPQEMRDIVLRSMGTLDMALGLVLGYYFGSSSGSRENQAAMRDAMK